MITFIRSIWNWCFIPDGGYSSHNHRMRPAAFWLIYSAMFIATFAYDTSHYPVLDCHDHSVSSPNDVPGVKPALAGAFWPLFWTWELAAPGKYPTCAVAPNSETD